MPQKNTLNYTLSCTVSPVAGNANQAYFLYGETALQSMPSAGVFRISHIRLDGNMSSDNFAEALLWPSGYENSFNIGLKYGNGRTNPIFTRDFYIKHFMELDVNQYFSLDGLDAQLYFTPTIFLSAINTALAGNGIPKLHLMLTIEQCTDSDFEKALQEGRI